MTVSAPVRFIPTPPLRVDRMKTKILGLELKRCIKICNGIDNVSAKVWDVQLVKCRHDIAAQDLVARL